MSTYSTLASADDWILQHNVITDTVHLELRMPAEFTANSHTLSLQLPAELLEHIGRLYTDIALPHQGAGMPWCHHCVSWHRVPRDETHRAALQCKAPLAGNIPEPDPQSDPAS